MGAQRLHGAKIPSYTTFPELVSEVKTADQMGRIVTTRGVVGEWKYNGTLLVPSGGINLRNAVSGTFMVTAQGGAGVAYSAADGIVATNGALVVDCFGAAVNISHLDRWDCISGEWYFDSTPAANDCHSIGFYQDPTHHIAGGLSYDGAAYDQTVSHSNPTAPGLVQNAASTGLTRTEFIYYNRPVATALKRYHIGGSAPNDAAVALINAPPSSTCETVNGLVIVAAQGGGTDVSTGCRSFSVAFRGA